LQKVKLFQRVGKHCKSIALQSIGVANYIAFVNKPIRKYNGVTKAYRTMYVTKKKLDK